MLICRTCGLSKELSEFYECKTAISKHHSSCKQCMISKAKVNALENQTRVQLTHKSTLSKRTSDYHKKHPEKVRIRKRKFRLAHPERCKESEHIRTLRWTISKSIKPLVLKRDNYKCVLCESKESLVLHHIVPVSKTDSSHVHSEYNLITLCSDCHKNIAHAGHFTRVDWVVAEKLLLKLFGMVPILLL